MHNNGDGTYTVSYKPEEIGRYVVTVMYAGVQVPNSPFSVVTSPTGDASKVKVRWLLMSREDLGVERFFRSVFH